MALGVFCFSAPCISKENAANPTLCSGKTGFEEGPQSVRLAGPSGWPPPHRGSFSWPIRGSRVLKAGFQAVSALRVPAGASPITIWCPRSPPTGLLAQLAASRGASGARGTQKSQQHGLGSVTRPRVDPSPTCQSARANRQAGCHTRPGTHLGSRLAH